MFNIIGLDHLVLRARDLDALVKFYCDVLGCTIERRQEKFGLIQLRAGNSLIDIVSSDGVLGSRGGEAPSPGNGHNLDHFCVRIEPFNEIEIRAHLNLHNVEASDLMNVYGAEGSGPSIYIKDPEGNSVELKGSANAPGV